MTLTAAVRMPERAVDAEVMVPAASTTAVVGPNGAGKSTLLAAVAGLLQPPDAQITLNGRVLTHTRGGRIQAWVPPHQRRTGLLAQQPRLFPHLDSLANVAFGPMARGIPRRTALDQARHWLEQVGADSLSSSRPHMLSGGQAARVAIARALADQPDVLLLDEPLTALDAEAVPALRTLLRTLLAGTTTVLVTHDVVDVMSLADRVVVLEAGHVQEQGTTEEVLTAPHSRFGANLAGINLLPGTWRLEGLQVAGGELIRGRASRIRPGERGVARFAPTAVTVYRQSPADPAASAVHVMVTSVEPVSGSLRVRATCPAGDISADITPAAGLDLAISPGRSLWFGMREDDVFIGPALPGTDHGRR